MIEARNLVKIYKPKKGVPVKALDDVSIKFANKGMVFILGKSGSGKSTLLNVLGGLDSIDSGEILIKGQTAESFKQADFDSYRNTYVGFIFQEYNILEEFSVGANIALAIELQGRKATNEEINEILKLVDLEGYGNRKPNELSGGQKQRVAIARALVKKPEIIMADEPTGALDSATGKQVFETLQKLSQEKLVLIVSHDREFAERYGDRIIELKDGKIIGDDEKIAGRQVVEEPFENVVYDNEEIHVKKGYKLTKKDLDAINEYLEKINTNVSINNQDHIFKENKKIGSNFRETDQSSIETSKEGYKLIKSKLPLKASFKIGASGLKHKKVRLAFTILLSFVAFTLFGLADTVSAYDFTKTCKTSLVDSNIDYASFVKKEKEIFYNEVYWNDVNTMSTSDVDKIKEDTGIYVKGVYTGNGADFSFSDNVDVLNSKDYNYCSNIFVTSFRGFVSVTQAELDNEYHYSIEGRLPSKDNEIAISKYVASVFNYADYVELDSKGTASKKDTLDSYNEIIGKSLRFNGIDYTVVGIIDTQFDYSRYDSLAKANLSGDAKELILYMALKQELSYAINYSLNAVAFVNEGYVEELAESNLSYFVDTYRYGTCSINHHVYFNNLEYWASPSYICKVSDINLPIKYFDGYSSVNSNEILLTYSELLDYYNNKIDSDSTVCINVSKDSISEFFYEDMINGEKVTNYQSISKYPETFDINEFDSNGLLTSLIYGKFAIEYVKNNPNSYSFLTGYSMQEVVDYYIDECTYINSKICKGKDYYSCMENLNKIAYKFFNNNQILNDVTLHLQKGYQGDTKEEKVKIVGLVGFGNSAIALNEDDFNYFTNNLEIGNYSYAVGPMPSNSKDIEAVIDYSYDTSKNIRYSLTNAVTYELEIIRDILSTLQGVFIWIGLFFAVFASLMLSNFIGTSVSYKKRDIGIIRAIGGRSWDVFQIFFSESFIIAIINFVLASIGTGIITAVINQALREEVGILITVVSFGIRQIGLILLICLFVAFISTLLPVNKYAKKRPIDTIRTIS